MAYKDPEYQRKYRLKNKEKLIIEHRNYYLSHKEERRVWIDNNREKMQAWRDDNKDRQREQSIKGREKRREYRHKNCKKIGEQRRQRRMVDIQARLKYGLRCRLNIAIRKSYKAGSAVRDLGCTIPEMKFYLEGQFQDGMTWANWAVDGWHIDHKIPLDFFDLADREQFLQAVHYTNLQPMWAKENIRKSNSLPKEMVERTEED